MFHSRIRDLVIPQAEHARLAARIAAAWNPRVFARFDCPRDSFVLGVSQHDRCFTGFDELPIGDIPDPVWVQAERSEGYGGRSGDPVAELFICMHIRRLARLRDGEDRSALAEQLTKAIDELRAESGLSADSAESLDSITAACDSIAFDFCFEEPTSRRLAVPGTDDGTHEMSYRLLPGGTVQIDPSPLSQRELTGYLIGYIGSRYPRTLEPVVVPYDIRGA